MVVRQEIRQAWNSSFSQICLRYLGSTMFLSIPWFCFSLLSFPIYCNSPKTFFSGGIEKLWGITFTFCFWERRNSCVDYPLQLVLLIFQIKVNSIAIVCMRSMDRGPEHTINRGFYVAEGAKMCSVEQVCLFILSVFFSGTGSNISSNY
ncbi:Tetratricopeptide repeat (TPR)-like superfamily protein [Zea mays]|jgi:hypothetical protein|uniref:Tetratricopeptide repeat (TPR)-like superfamily protein n=1 Tax=Zea mays TaxID=4577 RepID=A0A1D6KR78_MAIZE|nr:Tetratricopeptide repeat (TPR)-like superfamily protein [Zea mays]